MPPNKPAKGKSGSTKTAKSPSAAIPSAQGKPSQSELLKATLAKLKAAGTAQNRKVYARHGVTDDMFGVSFGTLRQLGKQQRPNQQLAEALWLTQNHDARLLACMVADPQQIARPQLTAWANQLNNYIVVDELAKLIAQTPHLAAISRRWQSSAKEWLGALAWTLVAYQAMGANELSDQHFNDLLAAIEAKIHQRPNRCRHSMNGALIAIGCRNRQLRRQAEAAAKRIGPVEVDHGETNCTTPDASDYLSRTWQHRQRRA